jgi:hypothetical protein
MTTTEKRITQRISPHVYRDIPTPILRSMLARNERDGFSGTIYTKAMRAEMLSRASGICADCYGNGTEGGASAADCPTCGGSGVASSCTVREGR